MEKSIQGADFQVFNFSLADDAPDRIWVVDTDYRFVYGNQTFQKDVLSFSGNKFVEGESFLRDAMPEDLKHKWKACYDRVLESGQTFVQSLPYFGFKEVDWMEFAFSPVKDDAGIISGVMVTGRDISKHRDMHQSLMRANNLLEATQRLTGVGGWEWTVDTGEMYWTRETYMIHDLDPDNCTLSGQNLVDFSLSCYCVLCREKLQEAFQECLDTGKSYDLELQFQTAKKRQLWVRTIGYAEVVNDKVVRVYGNIMDITRTKEEQRKLLYSEGKYKAIMEQAAEMLFLHDMDGNIVEVNRAAIQRTGFSQEELTGKKVFDIDPDAAGRFDNDKIWKQICASEKQTFEARHIGKSGEIYPVEVTVGKVMVEEDSFILAMVRDITERQRAEEELRRSEQHANALISSMPDMIFILDAEKRYLDYRAPAGDLLLSPELFLGKSVEEVMPESFVLQLGGRFEKTLSEGTLQMFEYSLDIPGKGIRWFECRLVPYYNHEVLSLVRDISHRKQLEQEILEREANARAIMEATTDVFILLNREGLILDCNQAHADRLGTTREEILGKDVFTLLPPETGARRKKMIEQVLDTGEPFFGVDYRGGFWNDISIFPVFVEGKQSEHVAVFSKNITERKKQNEALKQSEKKFRMLFENISEGIFIQDASGIVIDANEAAMRMLGLTSEQFLGKNSADPYWNVVDEQGQTLESGKHPSMVALRTGKVVLAQVVGIYVPQKSDFSWVIVDAIPHFIPEASVVDQVFVYMRDITDRKRSEDAIRKSEEKLKALNATKNKLFSIIAHDLRTPFTGITGFSDLLKSNAPKLDVSEIIQYASLIHLSARNTLNLLDNLLNWARIQQNSVKYQPRRLLLFNVVEEAIKVPCHTAAQKEIKVINQIPPTADVYGDEQMLDVLLRNLISNAIKFSHALGEVIIRCAALDGEMHVSVEDHGIGISEEDLPKLFNIDTNYTTRGTSNESGTGLGLTLCKDIVERHNGRIWVESKIGEGSVFTFVLSKKTDSDHL